MKCDDAWMACVMVDIHNVSTRGVYIETKYEPIAHIIVQGPRKQLQWYECNDIFEDIEIFTNPPVYKATIYLTDYFDSVPPWAIKVLAAKPCVALWVQ